MKVRFFYILTFFVLTSCRISHNYPKTQYPNSFDNPNIVNSFVDQNGNFYPDDWKKTFGHPPESGNINGYSLMKIAVEKGLDKQLSKFETTKLKQVQSRIKPKKRVFIFVHGFNTQAAAVNENYEYLRKLIKISPTNDEVIKFYWDGLYTTNPFSSGTIWFAATSFSQMAGEFGLRRLLNTIHGKQVFIISHSRGASVVLSALASPVFSDNLIGYMQTNHHLDVNKVVQLAENSNEITCLMLAPAIGLEDFKCTPDSGSAQQQAFQQLSKQVKKIHITTNSTDMMLKKFIGFLSNKLKATDLGYKQDVFNELVRVYPIMKCTDFTGQDSHAFGRYIRNPQFKMMLRENGILLNK